MIKNYRERSVSLVQEIRILLVPDAALGPAQGQWLPCTHSSCLPPSFLKDLNYPIRKFPASTSFGLCARYSTCTFLSPSNNKYDFETRFFFPKPMFVSQIDIYCTVNKVSLESKASRLCCLPAIYSLFHGCYFEPANWFQPNLTEVSKKFYWNQQQFMQC